MLRQALFYIKKRKEQLTMNEWKVVTEFNWVLWVAGLYALAEFAKWSVTIKDWFFKQLGIETKKMRKAREMQERLKKAEEAISEIKDTSKKNVEMFVQHEKQVVAQFIGIRDEIVVELGKLHNKIDKQQDEIEKNNEANNKTDCAMLRDRISSGMRYFTKNVKEDGKVHITLSDYENMDGLFQEYFSKHGNGAFKKMYKDEFEHFVIDR